MSKRTIQKYMHQVRKPSAPAGQRWSTFLENHIGDIWACDFLQLYDALFRPVFAFFIIDHATREVDRERPLNTTTKIVARPILGGLHHDYRRAA